MSRRLPFATVLAPLLIVLLVTWGSAETPPAWPEPTVTSRPWTRWWWHGSAVDEVNLARLLREYRDAGLGGVEITCIYPVKDNERLNRQYLSPQWRDAVQFAADEARTLGMGVDLPTGSGWRMGGPWLTEEFGNSRAVLTHQVVSGPKRVNVKLDGAALQAVTIVTPDGERHNLAQEIVDNHVDWNAPSGESHIYMLGYGWAGDRVKRPAPGGAGLNINPFWRDSFAAFIGGYSPHVADFEGLRSQFHDSFEYEGDYQPHFLAEFERRRGYNLQDYLPELSGEGDPSNGSRVRADYRATLADLVLDDLVLPWTEWCHARGELARNQAHGSPANWLDLYAAVDIPETESFGRLTGSDADPLVLKFASSAAHVAGRKLVACETATWLDEHFHVTLAQIKKLVDRQMLAGVNHVIYHGTAYSPAGAAWPGWLFYASTQLNPQNPIWRDLPALNTYVTRCQSLLQKSAPANDLLIYWPLHDTWHEGRGLRKEIRVHNGGDWLYGHPIGEASAELSTRGYQFDYVSDRLLQKCEATADGRVCAPGGAYKAILLPRAKYLPADTLAKLVELSDQGVPIAIWGEAAGSAPGLAGAQNDPAWQRLMKQLLSSQAVHQHDELAEAIDATPCRPEMWAAGLRVLRKSNAGRALYFVVNQSDDDVDTWVAPAEPFASATIMDPMTGQIAAAQSLQVDGHSTLRLQLAPGAAVFVQLGAESATSPVWKYTQPTGAAIPLAGPWSVEFIAGGPTLPKSRDLPTLKSWTAVGDLQLEAFAGTARYSTTIDVSAAERAFRLDLGNVEGSARVVWDGQPVATLLGPPFRVDLPDADAGRHELTVEVTGVAANRIRDLDRRGVEWRIFEDINIVTIDYKPFDASQWPVMPQGLLGPVTLTPLASD